MQKNSYVLGGEQSGHIILGNYILSGDGILTAIKILEIMSLTNKKTSKLFNLFKEYPQVKYNLPIKKTLNGNFETKLNKIIRLNKKQNPNLRYLVRKSGTEPLIRILVEGKNKNNVIKAGENINNEIKKIINNR